MILDTKKLRILFLADEADIRPDRLEETDSTSIRIRSFLGTLSKLGHEVLAESSSLPPLLENFQPDLVYERYGRSSAASSSLCRKKGIPYVVEILREITEIDACEQAALVTAGSPEIKKRLIQKGIPAEKIMVLACGIDETIFSKEGPVKILPAYHEKTVLGFMGSLEARHGVEFLLKAFVRLLAYPNYHLLVLGDGPMLKHFAALQKDFPNFLTLAGAVKYEEVPEWLRAVKIGLAPYPVPDNFAFCPQKIFEFMALGIPVVAPNAKPVQHWIRHQHNGWLYEPGSEEKFVSAVQVLAANEDLRSAMSFHAETDALFHHTWTIQITEMLQHLYRSPTSV